MKYFNKTHALILLIILLAFSQMTLHQKLEHLSSHLSSIQSEILNTRSLISSELYQLNQSESMYLFESFNVLTHELDLEKETLKLKFDLTFLKLPENGEVKIEISDKSERLYSSEPYGFEQSEASYTFKEIIVLEGDNNRYIGEMVLDLNRNYAFSLLVGDGGQQSKESLGTISALEWFKSPNTISVSMNGLSINAPSSGRFSFDLFIGNHFASDI